MRTSLAALVTLAALALTPALGGSASAWAQTESEEDAGGDRAKTLSGQLSSPFCPGKTLDGCTSPAAAEWRKDIRSWVDDGVSSQEIKRRLSERAGGQNLIAAPSSGFSNGWLVLSIVGSLLILGLASRKILTPAGGRSAEVPPSGDEDEEKIDAKYDERLDDELALLD